MREWLRNWGKPQTVTCISCGETVKRDDAREYDKYGNRWERTGKRFEHMCKQCYKQYKHVPRDEVQGRARKAEKEADTNEAFISAYVDDWSTVSER